MEISPDLITRFPWLPSLRLYKEDLASIEPVEFIKKYLANDGDIQLRERIYEFFKAAFDNLEHFDYYKTDDLNINFYLSLRILTSLINNKRITNRIANLYSKVAYQDLIQDIEREDYTKLYDICRDLNLNFVYEEEEKIIRVTYGKSLKESISTNFKLYFTDYLKLASNLRDEFRKLINNPLSGGYVYLTPRSIARLLQEFVRKKFLDNNERDDNLYDQVQNVPVIADLLQIILNDWDLKKGDYAFPVNIRFKKGEDQSSIFPPCMREILTRIRDGQNLLHIERLVITFFLHALEYPVEEIINLFSSSPDFDEKIARYQVEHAKKRGYIPHSCATLKSLSLCFAEPYNDKLCIEGYKGGEKKIAHPLAYIRIKQYRKNKFETKKKNE